MSAIENCRPQSNTGFGHAKPRDSSLRDISPTLTNLLNLNLPKEMTGGDLRVPVSL